MDVDVVLVDGRMHPNDSSAHAFEIAGAMAFREAITRASPILLEPMMAVEVTVPEDYLGKVIGDLNRRRGLVLGQEERAGRLVVTANVPLANLFGYIGDLRSQTAGRGSFAMELTGYQQVPDAIAKEACETA